MFYLSKFFEIILRLNAKSILEDRGMEGRRVKQENEMERRNDSENERDSEAGGKVNTVITVTIGSAGGVKQGAQTLNTSETAERLQQDLYKLATNANTWNQ